MTMHSSVRAAFAAVAVALLVMAAPQTEPTGPLKWWKGNLHTHSLWSDGDDFPESIVTWYRDHGYHFVALSDHNLLSNTERWMAVKQINARAGVNAFEAYRKRFGTPWVETRGSAEAGSLEVRLKKYEEFRQLAEKPGSFLVVQSEELTGEAGNGRALHMNATNLHQQLPFLPGADVREAMERNLKQVEELAKRTGQETLVHVNHPNYKWGVTAEDLAAVASERFFEVWNGVETDNDPGDATRPGTDRIWDRANLLRLTRYKSAPLFGLATDDSHDYHGNKSRAQPGRAWIQVRARSLDAAALIRAIRAGDFYASTGVTLRDVRFDRRTLSLQIEQHGAERLTTQFIGTRKGSGKAGEVLAEVSGTSPRYKLRGDELYVRAVVVSSAVPRVPSAELSNQMAWTQPVGWR